MSPSPLSSPPRRPPRLRACALVAAAAVALGPAAARACATCLCGDPTLTTLGVEKPFRNRVRLAADLSFGAHLQGEGEAAHESRTLRASLVGVWSPSDRVTLLARLPLVTSWVLEPRRPTATIAGLGDAELTARVVVARDRRFAPRHLASVMAGLKLPTGPRVRDDAGYPYSEDDQPGSGSWDPIAGVSYGYYGGAVAVFTSATLRWATPGRRGWQRGSTVLGTVGAQVQPWERVALGASLDGRWQAADRDPAGVDVPDTGGAMLAFTPAVIVSPTTNWILKLAVQMHIADWLRGAQQESTAVMLSTVIDFN